jgi:DNA-binding XRE family transcriptional regulator
MSEHIKHQIIERNGEPMFVVVPYDEYMELLGERPDDEVYLPHEVVGMNGLEGKSLVRAWREYKGFTQRQIAERMGVSQSAYAQMEKPGVNLRLLTRRKIAQALGVQPEQIRE